MKKYKWWWVEREDWTWRLLNHWSPTAFTDWHIKIEREMCFKNNEFELIYRHFCLVSQGTKQHVCGHKKQKRNSSSYFLKLEEQQPIWIIKENQPPCYWEIAVGGFETKKRTGSRTIPWSKRCRHFFEAGNSTSKILKTVALRFSDPCSCALNLLFSSQFHAIKYKHPQSDQV